MLPKFFPHKQKKPFIKPISIGLASFSVGFGTLCSRLTGFFRDVVVAASLGAGNFADIFVIVFRLPHLFRHLFAEGIFNVAFTPLFAKTFGTSRKKALVFAQETLVLLFWVMLGFTALCQIFMPLIIYMLASGFGFGSDKMTLTIALSRVSIFYLAFISMAALFGAVLNALGRFTIVAFAPILLNLTLILGVFVSHHIGKHPLPFLVWGIVLAGILHFLLLYGATFKAGFGVRFWVFRRPKLNQYVKRFLRLSMPAILAGGVLQINILIGTSIASHQDGAPSWLYYAERLYQLPLAVIGLALSTALLPSLAHCLRHKDQEKFRTAFYRASQFGLMFAMPAAMGLFVLSHPIFVVLFERGAFQAMDSKHCAIALKGFCLGLMAFIFVKIFQSVFFAQEDTKTPLKCSCVNVCINITFSLILFPLYGYIAIPIATTLGAWVDVVLLGFFLKGKANIKPPQYFLHKCGTIFLASLLMLVWLLFSTQQIPFETQNGLLEQFIWLFGMILSAVCLFLFFLFIGYYLLKQQMIKLGNKNHKN